MDGPVVTVVTPTYNQGEFIEDTLQSVKGQDYDHIEHIVVDGGSTDRTLDVLEAYEDEYGMEWMSESDEGQADAITKGFECADGEILAWLNSDDIYLTSTAVSRMVERFQAYPEVDVVNGKGMLLAPDGEWARPMRRDDHLVCHERLRHGQRILQPATFWRSYVFDEVPFDLSLTYAFDWDFFIRVAERFNILPVNEYIAGAKFHGDNKTTVGGLRRTREFREVTGRHIGRQTWQYAVMGAYCGMFRALNELPDDIRRSGEKAVKRLSRGISHLTQRRIASL